MEYRLDLSTLLLMLGQSTGDLHAILQNVPKVRGRCQVFLRLEKGSLLACSIKNDRGNEIISGDAAIKLIQNTVLEWRYTEDRPQTNPTMAVAPRQQSAFISSASIPQRTYPIPQSEFMSWPRLYRAVYSLVDGKSSVDYLVTLIGREQGVEQVLEALRLLQERGLIVF